MIKVGFFTFLHVESVGCREVSHTRYYDENHLGSLGMTKVSFLLHAWVAQDIMAQTILVFEDDQGWICHSGPDQELFMLVLG